MSTPPDKSTEMKIAQVSGSMGLIDLVAKNPADILVANGCKVVGFDLRSGQIVLQARQIELKINNEQPVRAVS